MFSYLQVKSLFLSKEFLGSSIIVALFLISALFSQAFDQEIRDALTAYQFFGIVLYVFAGFVATIIAPISSVFLIPLAVTLWGPLATALLSIFAWGLGSVVAYYLARTFGRPLVEHFADLSNVDKVGRVLPQKKIFIWIVLARMAMPVDILSYALGLFLKVPYRTYTLATIIGIAPFAFVFSYASSAPPIYIAGAGILALIAASLGAYWFHRALKEARRKESVPKARP